jgi:hypothetical protein
VFNCKDWFIVFNTLILQAYLWLKILSNIAFRSTPSVSNANLISRCRLVILLHFLFFPRVLVAQYHFYLTFQRFLQKSLNCETSYFANDWVLCYFLSIRSTSLTAQFQTVQAIFSRSPDKWLRTVFTFWWYRSKTTSDCNNICVCFHLTARTFHEASIIHISSIVTSSCPSLCIAYFLKVKLGIFKRVK